MSDASTSSKHQLLDAAWGDFCRDTPVGLRGPWEAFKYALESRRHTGETSPLAFSYATCNSGGGGKPTVTIGFETLSEAQGMHGWLIKSQRSAVETTEKQMNFIDVVFDGPPSHESGRFVEVEDPSGKSISAGQWIDRGNGLWALRIPRSPEPLCELLTEGVRLRGWCDTPLPGQPYPEYACGKCWTCRVRATLAEIRPVEPACKYCAAGVPIEIERENDNWRFHTTGTGIHPCSAVNGSEEHT